MREDVNVRTVRIVRWNRDSNRLEGKLNIQFYLTTDSYDIGTNRVMPFGFERNMDEAMDMKIGFTFSYSTGRRFTDYGSKITTGDASVSFEAQPSEVKEKFDELTECTWYTAKFDLSVLANQLEDWLKNRRVIETRIGGVNFVVSSTEFGEAKVDIDQHCNDKRIGVCYCNC